MTMMLVMTIYMLSPSCQARLDVCRVLEGLHHLLNSQLGRRLREVDIPRHHHVDRVPEVLKRFPDN